MQNKLGKVCLLLIVSKLPLVSLSRKECSLFRAIFGLHKQVHTIDPLIRVFTFCGFNYSGQQRSENIKWKIPEMSNS